MIGNPFTWWLYLMNILGPILGSLVSIVLVFVFVSLLSRLLQFLFGLLSK